MAKIAYNKLLPKKRPGGSTVRDMQRKQVGTQGSVTIQLPTASLEELKKLLLLEQQGKNAEEGPVENVLSFEEVKRKLDEAVEFTRKQEKEKYESGLVNLNEQLDIIKKKIAATEDQLINKSAEIKKLKSEATGMPQDFIKTVDQKESEIDSLEIQLREKEIQLNEKNGVIKHLSDNYAQSMEELKNKVDNIASRISAGKAFIPDEDRPGIEDDVFIDPLDKDNEPELDPHIRVDASVIEVDRNVIDDLAKLKDLLGKGTAKKKTD